MGNPTSSPPTIAAEVGPATLTDLLLRRERQHAPALLYLDANGAVMETFSFAEFVHRARQAAQVLLALGARDCRVLLLVSPGPAYLEWFVGCALAGAVA